MYKQLARPLPHERGSATRLIDYNLSWHLFIVCERERERERECVCVCVSEYV